MAFDVNSPITAKAWKGLMYALSRHAPMRLGQVVQAGKSMRALTATKRKR